MVVNTELLATNNKRIVKTFEYNDILPSAPIFPYLLFHIQMTISL